MPDQKGSKRQLRRSRLVEMGCVRPVANVICLTSAQVFCSSYCARAVSRTSPKPVVSPLPQCCGTTSAVRESWCLLMRIDNCVALSDCTSTARSHGERRGGDVEKGPCTAKPSTFPACPSSFEQLQPSANIQRLATDLIDSRTKTLSPDIHSTHTRDSIEYGQRAVAAKMDFSDIL